MRKISFVVSLMIFALLFVNTGSAQSSDISLMLNKQTPYPVEPGQILNLEIALQNNGSSSPGITLEIVPAAPFTLLPGEDSTKTFSSIGALDTVTETYKLKVDISAVSATYDLEFRYYSPGSSTQISKNIPVTVQGTPKIIIEEIVTSNAVIEPGHEAEFDVKLKNAGTGEAIHLEMNLVAEADSETGESFIVPVLSGGAFYIDSMEPGEEKSGIFRLDISNEAEYKSYLSTLTINYKDETGADNAITKTIGIPVKGSPVIEILSAKVENGDFKVDIENIGTGSAKALKIEFIQDGEMKDSSVASELKPTRHKTLRFSGFRYGDAVIKISYLDESNEVFVNENIVTVKRSATSDDGRGTDYSGYAGILLVLVLGEGFYIWRLRKKLKK
ncbi:MAG: hypothetical protein KAT35_04120 [Candidatus Aenigmarchaeota archaeon]|nr:hypothetical protein [Candidatus Aenigmarchaeota archaeon]